MDEATLNAGQPSPSFDAIEFLSRIVQVPSCDPPGGELEVARMVHEAMLSLGIESILDEFQPGRANVLGRVRGSGKRKSFVFSSHMDTLPPGTEGWNRDPFSGTVENGNVHGRGTTDMKCALAAMIAAAGEIVAAGSPLDGDLVLAFTAGESNNLLGARRFVDQGLKEEIGAFLCGEPSNLDIVVVEKAVLCAKIIARGRMGHVSGEGGVNAIDAMMGALALLKSFPLDFPKHPLLDAPTLTITRINGGWANNATPDLCETIIDIRLPPNIAPEGVLLNLRDHLGPSFGVELVEFKPAVEEKPDSPFVQLCQEACTAVRGHEAKILGVSYYSDGTVLMDGVDAPFAIIGAGELGGSGTPNESVPVGNVEKAVWIYKTIAEQWLRPQV
jgi:succinyl-diaminopimelate desuccinylase